MVQYLNTFIGRKLLLVDLGSVWGGQEIYSKSIAREMGRRGWSVGCISPHTRHATEDVQYYPCKIDYPHFCQTARLVQTIGKDYDLIHFNGIRAIYLSLLLHKTKPFVGTKHSPYSCVGESFAKSKFARMASKMVFYHLDRLICISDSIYEELPTHFKERSTIIYNGVKDEGSPRFRFSQDQPLTICFVGRLVEHKGVIKLLEAADMLYQQDIIVRTLVAGTGPLEQSLRAFVKERGLENIVSFLGYVESPGYVFRQSHACVLPSLYEGLPLSLIEAMSARCAVIGHDIPGVRKIIRHEQNGLMAENSSESLAESIQRLNSDRCLLERLRETARKDYENQWQLDRMIDETETVYREVIFSSLFKGSL